MTEKTAGNTPPQGASSKPITTSATTVADPDAGKKTPQQLEAEAKEKKAAEDKAKLDAQIAAEVDAGGSEVDPKAQAAIDAAMGNAAETDSSLEDGDDEDVAVPAKGWQERAEAASKKIVKLVRSIPKDTPDEHVIWGFAGQTLLVGDLRAFVAGAPKGYGE